MEEWNWRVLNVKAVVDAMTAEDDLEKREDV